MSDGSDKFGTFYHFNGQKTYVDKFGRDLLPQPPQNNRTPIRHAAGWSDISGAQARSDLATRMAAESSATERQKKQKLTNGLLLATTVVLAAWGGKHLHGWATDDPRLANMESTAAAEPQIKALKDALAKSEECSLGGVNKPGYFTGPYWRNVVQEETCWVSLNDYLLKILNLSLGENNVDGIIRDYKKTNRKNFQNYNDVTITREQSFELVELLSLRVHDAGKYLQDELQRIAKEEKDKTAVAKWEVQPVELPPMSEAKFKELLLKVRQQEGNLLFGTASDDVSKYTAGGGTRRKRHKGRKTKKHHKSKQKKSTRRVRRKHQGRRKRKTRRKS